MKDNIFDLIQRASHLVEIDRFREAIQLLLKARSIDPENSYISALLSQSFLGLEDHKQGLKYAEEAVGLDPDAEWGHRLRSIALGELDRDQDSLAAALDAARIDPEDPYVLSTVANAQISCNKVDDARATAEKLRELYPEMEIAHFTYGNYCLKNGDHRAAEKSFQKALEINPLSSLARNNLAVAILRKGEERAYKPLFGSTPSILETGGEDDVHRHFGEAIKLDPTSDLAIRNFQNQFRYVTPFYLAIALVPFGMMAFFVNPFWVLIWAIVYAISIVNILRGIRRKRMEIADDLKGILNNLPRIALKDRVQEFANFLQNFARKTWPAHALAVGAVALSALRFDDGSRPSGTTWNRGLAYLIMLFSVFWINKLIAQPDDE